MAPPTKPSGWVDPNDLTDDEYEILFGHPKPKPGSAPGPTPAPPVKPPKPDAPSMKDIGNWAYSRGADIASTVAGMPGGFVDLTKMLDQVFRENLGKYGYKRYADIDSDEERARLGVPPRGPRRVQSAFPLKPGMPGYDPEGDPNKHNPIETRIPDFLPRQEPTRKWLHKPTIGGWNPYEVPEQGTPGRFGKYVDEGIANAGASIPFGMGALRPFVAATNFAAGAGGAYVGDQPGIKGTVWEPIAKIGTTAGISALGGAPAMLRPTTGSIVRKATKGMTEKQWDIADETFKKHPGMITAPEAIVPDMNHPLARTYSNVAASPQGGPLNEAARKRLPLMDRIVGYYLDKFAPGANPNRGPGEPRFDPTTVETELGKSAKAATLAPWVERQAAAKLSYAAAKPQPVDPAVMAHGFLDMRRARSEARQPLPDGSHGSPQYHAADDVLQKLQTVRNTDDLLQLESELENIIKLRAPGDSKLQDELRTRIKPVLTDMYNRLTGTNPDLARGESFYRQYGTRDARTGEPKPSQQTADWEAAQRGPLGQVAKTVVPPGEFVPGSTQGAFEAQAIKPPGEGGKGGTTPAQIKETARRLREQDAKELADTGVDPKTGERAFVTYLERTYGEKAAPPRGHQRNPMQGPDFANEVAGSPQQRANLRAWVTEIAGGNQTTAAGFDKLMEIMQRQGFIPGIGSPTATRGAERELIRDSGVVSRTLDAASLKVSNWWKDFRFNKSYTELANLATHPDGVRMLQKLAQLDPNSPAAQNLARALLEGYFTGERGGR